MRRVQTEGAKETKSVAGMKKSSREVGGSLKEKKVFQVIVI